MPDDWTIQCKHCGKMFDLSTQGGGVVELDRATGKIALSTGELCEFCLRTYPWKRSRELVTA